MAVALNNTQLEILELMEHFKKDKDLAEIKSLLVAYLADKVVRSADESFDEKQHKSSIFETWKNNHFRQSVL